jgi:hypothetical protein
MNFLKKSGFVAFAVAMFGCASIMSGRNQNLVFHSNPSGATVKIDDKEVGRTPLTHAMAKDGEHHATFEKEGYKSSTFKLEKRLNGWFWGNIIFGGLLGSSTDAGTGSMREYAQGQYMATLEPLGAGSMETHTSQTEKQKVKDFIVVGYNSLMTDLKRGGGDYLKSLNQMLMVPADKVEEATKRIRALADAYPTIPEFADRVADAFVKTENKPAQ